MRLFIVWPAMESVEMWGSGFKWNPAMRICMRGKQTLFWVFISNLCAFFSREDSAPKIQNSDCDDCPLCRSRSSQLRDSCDSIDTQHGNSFYAMVVAHKDYINATITFSALNLDEVTETSDWNLAESFLRNKRWKESPKGKESKALINFGQKSKKRHLENLFCHLLHQQQTWVQLLYRAIPNVEVSQRK